MKLYGLLFTIALTALLLFPDLRAENSLALKFNEQGSFRIVQFTDIHFELNSRKSKKALKMMGRILDVENPDLVVLTGDIVTTKRAGKGWRSVISPMIEREIPWTVTLGNHDDEYDLTRTDIFNLLEKEPFSCVAKGPDDVDGIGNFTIKINDMIFNQVLFLY